MSMNGVMIDCSRLMEKHEYYFRIVDFMEEWKADTLVFHFTDDHGLGIELPGFKDIAMPHAFTTREVQRLIDYAAEKGIEVIPELETFGHIRYLTDHKKYAHLYAGKSRKYLSFNAIDPLNLESKKVMRKLMRETCKLFRSRYLHVGCDEVNLEEYCKDKPGLTKGQIWSDYVNTMILMARDFGKEPIIWGDHPMGHKDIATALRKDVTVAWWNYNPKPEEQQIKNLIKAGFSHIINAPSVASYNYRFLVPEWSIKNMDSMSKYAKKYKCEGIINTIWCPWRYPQGAVYYGIAYGAESYRKKGKVNRREFNRKFVRKTFGKSITPDVQKYLLNWTKAEFTALMACAVHNAIHEKKYTPEGDTIERIKTVNKLWRETRLIAENFSPKHNRDIWQAMRLAHDVCGICTEFYLLKKSKTKNTKRKAAYNELLENVLLRLDTDWDATRFEDDPQKKKYRFANWSDQNMILLLNSMPKL